MPKKTKNQRGQKTKQGYISTAFKTPDLPDYVIAELKYESPVAFAATGFTASADGEAQASSLTRVLSNYDIAAVRSHFGKKREQVSHRIDVARALPARAAAAIEAKDLDADFVQSSYVQIVPKKRDDAPKLARELQRQGVGSQSYVSPQPGSCANGNGTRRGYPQYKPDTG